MEVLFGNAELCFLFCEILNRISEGVFSIKERTLMETIKGKSSTSYRSKVYDSSGRAVYKSFRTKSDAKIWKEELRSAKRKDPLFVVKMNKRRTFKELYEEWFNLKIKNRRVLKTVYQYEKIYLKYFKQFDNRSIQSMTAKDAEMFLNSLIQSGLKPKSVNNVFVLLRQIFKYALEQQMISKNSLRMVRKVEEPEKSIKFYTKEEIAALLNANVNEPIYQVLVFALNCGARISEIAGLKFDCLDFGSRKITIKRIIARMSGLQEFTKTKQIRIIPMNDAVYEVLKAQHDAKNGQGYVFTNRFGDFINPDHYSSVEFRRALAKANVEKILGFHSLRHSFASHYMINNGNVFNLQKLLGHTNIKTTMRYIHLSPDHLLEASKVVDFRANAIKIEPDSYKIATPALRLVK